MGRGDARPDRLRGDAVQRLEQGDGLGPERLPDALFLQRLVPVGQRLVEGDVVEVDVAFVGCICHCMLIAS